MVPNLFTVSRSVHKPYIFRSCPNLKILIILEWLYNIKIKNKDSCDFCGRVDDIPHYFLKCPKVEEFWSYWIHCWEQISGIDIKDSPVLDECIIFGFPTNTDAMQV